MKFEFKPAIKKPVPKGGFRIKFNYTHGDADQTTNATQFFPIPKDDLQLLLDEIGRGSDVIDTSRSRGESVDRDFEENAKFRGTYIPVELDSFAMHSMSNYYADMDWESIVYFDENGNEFDVKVVY